MPFLQTWDETFPSDTQLASYGADDIRRLTQAVRERLAVDHYALAVEGADPNIGFHKKITLIDQVNDLLGVAGATVVYGKTVSSTIELFLVLSNNTAYQLTLGGKPWISALNVAGQINQDMIRFDGSKWDRFAWTDLITELNSDLTFPVDGFGTGLIHVRDEKPNGTPGGTFTLGAWRTRDLNTVKTNEVSGASLGTNQITLPAGTYYIDAAAPASGVSSHKAKLYNITDGADVIFGTTELSSATAYNTASKIYGRFTIAGPKVFEIQHIGSLTAVDDGFGNGADVTFAAIAVYTEVKIWKVA